MGRSIDRAAQAEALIAHRLLTLAEAFGERSAAGTQQLTVRLSQEDIATLVGLSRQRVNQEVQRLAAMGVLDAAYGDIRVHDIEALRREALYGGDVQAYFRPMQLA